MGNGQRICGGLGGSIEVVVIIVYCGDSGGCGNVVVEVMWWCWYL